MAINDAAPETPGDEMPRPLDPDTERDPERDWQRFLRALRRARAGHFTERVEPRDQEPREGPRA